MPIAPYVITFSPGSPNAGFTIQPGTVNGENQLVGPPNSNTTLVLPGYGKVAYGEWLVEDFVRMLENFASATSPTNPVIGQLWYDTSVQSLKAWNGTSYDALVTKTSGADISVSYSGNPPIGTMIGGYVATRSLSLPVNFVGSFARADVASAVPYTINILKNGGSVGSISFAALSTTGTFTVASSVSLVAGDVLRLVSATTDLNLKDIVLNLKATLI